MDFGFDYFISFYFWSIENISVCVGLCNAMK